MTRAAKPARAALIIKILLIRGEKGREENEAISVTSRGIKAFSFNYNRSQGITFSIDVDRAMDRAERSGEGGGGGGSGFVGGQPQWFIRRR